MVQEHLITFGPFRLETTQARLWRGEQAIPLRPRTGAVLQYVATHPGRLVTKTELRQHIWAGTHVTETVLRVCIREIRVALADAAAAPQYLQTVGRQGYQWLVSGDGAAFPQAVQRTGLKLFLPYCLALLAEAHGQAGQPEAGLSVLAEALMLVEATEERWWEARASGTRPGR